MNNGEDIEMGNLEQKMDKIENLKIENPDVDINDFIQYKTCCSNSSKAFINYMSKLFISILIISFCVYMIVNSEEGADNSIHYSLISSIMSVYVQPNAHEDKR